MTNCKECIHCEVCEKEIVGKCEYFSDREQWLHSDIPIGKTVYRVEVHQIQTPVEINGKTYWTYKNKNYITKREWSWEDAAIFRNGTIKFYTNHEEAIKEKKRLDEEQNDAENK